MITTRLRGGIKHGVVRFFGARLPDRMKRLVYLASLGAYIKGSTSLDDATISKLNKVMALGSNDKALKLPVLLSKAIWDGKVTPLPHDVYMEHQLGAATVEKVMAHAAVAGTPKWLRYGEEQLIQNDVEKLLSIFRSQREVPQLA